MNYKQHKHVGDSILVGTNVTLPQGENAVGKIMFSQNERIGFTSREFFRELSDYNDHVAAYESIEKFWEAIEHDGLEAVVQRTFGDINAWAGDHAKFNPPDGKKKKFRDLKVLLQKVEGLQDFNYVKLALNNWDHFTPMSYKMWQVFHKSALVYAQQFANGSEKKTVPGNLIFDLDGCDLAKALFLDAYGCHFLEDCFISGHVRTPRLLFGSDHDSLHSLKMHNTDNKNRLKVQNKNGDEFTLIGEDEEDDFSDPAVVANDPIVKALREHAVGAVAASVQQIFDAALGVKQVSDIDSDEIGKKVPQVRIYWNKLAPERSRTHSLEILPLTSASLPKPLFKFHADFDRNKGKFKKPVLVKRTRDNSWRREWLSDVDNFTPGRGLADWVPGTPDEETIMP